MKKIARILPLSLLLPSLAFAQDLGWFENLANSIGDLVATLIPIVIAIGLLFFIWGLVQFIAASGDEGAKEEGKRKMIWGIIALFVIVAVWGLVELVATMFGVETGGSIDTPQVPGA